MVSACCAHRGVRRQAAYRGVRGPPLDELLEQLHNGTCSDRDASDGTRDIGHEPPPPSP
jgi:hypothetical protein